MGDTLTDIMYRIEGIEHFAIANLYSFEYFNDEQIVSQDSLSLNEIISQWFSNLREVNA